MQGLCSDSIRNDTHVNEGKVVLNQRNSLCALLTIREGPGSSLKPEKKAIRLWGGWPFKLVALIRHKF